jgi:hypothetical protein
MSLATCLLLVMYVASNGHAVELLHAPRPGSYLAHERVSVPGPWHEVQFDILLDE